MTKTAVAGLPGTRESTWAVASDAAMRAHAPEQYSTILRRPDPAVQPPRRHQKPEVLLKRSDPVAYGTSHESRSSAACANETWRATASRVRNVANEEANDSG